MTDMTPAQAAQQNNRSNDGKYTTKVQGEAAGVDLGAGPADSRTAAVALHRDLAAEGSVSEDFDTWYASGGDLKYRYSDIEGLDGLDNDEIETLRVIIDPANDPSTRDEEGLMYELEAFDAFINADAMSQYDEIGSIVAQSYQDEYGPGRMIVNVPDSDGGERPYYHVSMSLGPDGGGLFLSDMADSKYLCNGDYNASGVKAAVGAAQVVDGDILRIRKQAAKLGLLPADQVERKSKR